MRLIALLVFAGLVEIAMDGVADLYIIHTFIQPFVDTMNTISQALS